MVTERHYREGTEIMAIATINPATGEVVQTFQPLSEAEIERKLQLAVTAFWAERKTPFAVRTQRMMKAAQILEKLWSADDPGDGQAL